MISLVNLLLPKTLCSSITNLTPFADSLANLCLPLILVQTIQPETYLSFCFGEFLNGNCAGSVNTLPNFLFQADFSHSFKALLNFHLTREQEHVDILILIQYLSFKMEKYIHNTNIFQLLISSSQNLVILGQVILISKMLCTKQLLTSVDLLKLIIIFS